MAQNSAATKVANLLTRHDVNLNRLEAGARKKVLAILRQLYRTLRGHINEIDPTGVKRLAYRNRRLGILVEVANKDIDKAYGQIRRFMASELGELSVVEAQNLAQTVNSVIGVNLVSGTLNENVLKEIADDTLIQGARFSEQIKRQTLGFRQAFRDQMNEGILLSEPIPDLTRRVRNVSQTNSRQARALVRSSVQAVAQNARMETYRQNDEVIKGQQWLSTLDSRTSDICIALDGQAWYLDGRRMPGTTASWQGPPPAHWNCRSTLTPVLKTWGELTKNPKLRKKLNRLEKRSRQKFQAVRSSLDGNVADTTTYETWLKGQDVDMQKKVLGATKYKLWKKGKISLTDLIDQSQNPISVAELKQKVDARAT